MNINRFKILIILIIFSTTCIAQMKLPPVTNFNVKDYKGGNQNWSIDSNGEYIYFANNEGLIEFDGINWYLNTLPNKTIVRSVKVVGDKIYTGSYEEFGYWKRAATGKLQYTSLSKEISQKDVTSQSIWEIYHLNDRVIFKSFGVLYIYENNRIKVIRPNFILMAGTIFNGKFIVQGIGKGLLELDGYELKAIDNSTELANKRVQSLISFKDDELLIGTSLNGCYTYSSKGLYRWNNDFNNLLKENQLNTLAYSKGKLYVGTIKNGLYQYNIEKNTFFNLNVKNGLQNNTVLASYIDANNILWLALDNGISAVPINFYAYYLNPYKEDIGAVYDIVKLVNKAYVATNTGIYKIDDTGIYFIEGSQGHTWSLTLIGNEIICGHNSGTFKIDNGKLTLLTKKNGGYVFKNIPEQENQYIQGNYSGLTLYDKSNKWKNVDVAGLNFPVKNIVFEKPNVAWVLHAYKGVFRVFFSNDHKKIIKIENKYNKEISNLYNIKLFKIENNIAFFSNDKWFHYNPLEDRIQEFNSFNKILGKDKDAVLMNKFYDKPLVFKKIKDNTIFIRENLQDSLSQIYLPKKYYDNKLVRGEGEQRAIVASDSLVYIALYNDVLVINPKKVVHKSAVKPPTISRIYKNKKLQKLGSEIHLKENDTLNIELSAPYLSNHSIEYSLGNNQWIIANNGEIELTGLPYGSENVLIRSFFNFKEYSEESKIELYVATPWYLGIWGLLSALFIIVLIFYLITTINKYVLIKHKNYLEDQYKHQQEIHRKEEALKNEKKVNELLKKQHEIELKSKTKELANTAMEMTKKDELLDNLKGELQIFKKEIINKPRFEKLLKTINKNINTSKDWEVFETNFNEIHDSFFKSLVKNHKHLTSKDLKLCAYLKMNLSTKEIAPLMGISARGVEIHRYRLRKKLELHSDQNINEYLMNIS